MESEFSGVGLAHRLIDDGSEDGKGSLADSLHDGMSLTPGVVYRDRRAGFSQAALLAFRNG